MKAKTKNRIGWIIFFSLIGALFLFCCYAIAKAAEVDFGWPFIVGFLSLPALLAALWFGFNWVLNFISAEDKEESTDGEG